ncbi:MAG: putative ABC transporter permease [Bacilli bacterium]|nr:putative ABC transporter permease [Bacilli bacterium]
MYYINTFLFYSILGHILESFIYTKIDSGILYGYWTPVYGTGVLLIILINYLICRKFKNKLIRPIILFITCALILGLFELMSGLVIEKIFGRVFWDYSNEMFSIFKYTSLKMMFIWGISSLLLIYIIHPYIHFIIKKIPRFIFSILAFLFIFDLIYTLITIGN